MFWIGLFVNAGGHFNPFIQHALADGWRSGVTHWQRQTFSLQ